jgi:flagellar capping protein FliD
VKRNIVSFLFCICLFFVAGCATTAVSASSAKFRDAQYAPTDPSKIEVFSVAFPKKEYIGLAVIKSSSEKDLEKAKIEAAKLGADAIIIIAWNKAHSQRDYYRAADGSYVTGASRTTITQDRSQCVAIKFK